MLTWDKLNDASRCALRPITESLKKALRKEGGQKSNLRYLIYGQLV